jgi:hypothetical protein
MKTKGTDSKHIASAGFIHNGAEKAQEKGLGHPPTTLAYRTHSSEKTPRASPFFYFLKLTWSRDRQACRQGQTDGRGKQGARGKEVLKTGSLSENSV